MRPFFCRSVLDLKPQDTCLRFAIRQYDVFLSLRFGYCLTIFLITPIDQQCPSDQNSYYWHQK